MSSSQSDLETGEIRRNELKRLVASAIGGGAALLLPQSPPAPSPGPASFAVPPRASAPPPLLLDAEWCLVARGTYVSMMEFREKLRQGPLAFAWMGTQRGPGLFQPGPFLTVGQAVLGADDKVRIASRECVFDRSPLHLDPSLDRWQCAGCGSAFSTKNGRVLSPPAEKPLLVFEERELADGKRLALLPPNARPPR